jgi:hypothetical protein
VHLLVKDMYDRLKMHGMNNIKNTLFPFSLSESQISILSTLLSYGTKQIMFKSNLVDFLNKAGKVRVT